MVKLQRYAIFLHIALFVAAVSCALVFNQGDVRYDGPIGFLTFYVIAVNALFGFGHGLVGVVLSTALSFMSRYTQEATVGSILTDGDFLAHVVLLILTTLLVGLLHDNHMRYLLYQPGAFASRRDKPTAPPTEEIAAPAVEPQAPVVEAEDMPPEPVALSVEPEPSFFSEEALPGPIEPQDDEAVEAEPTPPAAMPEETDAMPQPDPHLVAQSLLWADTLEKVAAIEPPPQPTMKHGFAGKRYIKLKVPIQPPTQQEYLSMHKKSPKK